MNIFAPHAKDFYKTGHPTMYPEGTDYVYNNFTPRTAKLAKMLPDFDGKVVFAGLQGMLQSVLIELWNESFFKQPKEKVIKRYKRRMDTALGPNAVPIDKLEALHDLGFLPIAIKALPEGSRVNMKVPVFTCINTIAGFGWVCGMLEDQFSAEVWKTTTTATIAFEFRRLLQAYAIETGSPLDFVQWQGHDFSMRGMSGIHDAARSGAGHLFSFTGTDTILAIDYVEDYYGADADNELIGGSIPATEHSVMCMGGQDDELETIRRIIEDLYPSGNVSVVSDSWDYWNVVSNTTVKLKPIIEARKPDALGNAKVVFRPDSGDPVQVICGLRLFPEPFADEADFYGKVDHPDTGLTSYGSRISNYELTYDVVEVDGTYRQVIESWGDDDFITERLKLGREVGKAEVLGSLASLWNVFGGTVNDKGYRVLNPRVGLIYGDSITLERAQAILRRMKELGFASCNIVFGIGSYTYNYNTRDTFGHAMKATWGQVNGEAREIFKDPATGDKTKKSARGLLRVVKEGDDFVLYDQQTVFDEMGGELKTVFINGELRNVTTLGEIRDRLAGELHSRTATIA